MFYMLLNFFVYLYAIVVVIHKKPHYAIPRSTVKDVSK